jgi:hypothetical protein
MLQDPWPSAVTLKWHPRPVSYKLQMLSARVLEWYASDRFFHDALVHPVCLLVANSDAVCCLWLIVFSPERGKWGVIIQTVGQCTHTWVCLPPARRISCVIVLFSEFYRTPYAVLWGRDLVCTLAANFWDILVEDSYLDVGQSLFIGPWSSGSFWRSDSVECCSQVLASWSSRLGFPPA